MNLKNVIAVPIATILFTCAFAISSASAGEDETAEFKSKVKKNKVKHELEYYIPDPPQAVTLQLDVTGSVVFSATCTYSPAVGSTPASVTPSWDATTPLPPEVTAKCEFEDDEKELELEVKFISNSDATATPPVHVVEGALATIMNSDGITHQSEHTVSAPAHSVFPYEMESEWEATLPESAPVLTCVFPDVLLSDNTCGPGSLF